MLRKISFGITLLFFAGNARANLDVKDPVGWVQYGVAEVVNYANWAAQETNSAATELNTLHNYEQPVIQLARMGHPPALAQLTGARSITSLYRDYAMMSAPIQQMKNAVNPQNFQTH